VKEFGRPSRSSPFFTISPPKREEGLEEKGRWKTTHLVEISKEDSIN